MKDTRNDSYFASVNRRTRHSRTCQRSNGTYLQYHGYRVDPRRLPAVVRYDCPCGWFQWLSLTEPFGTRTPENIHKTFA